MNKKECSVSQWNESSLVQSSSFHLTFASLLWTEHFLKLWIALVKDAGVILPSQSLLERYTMQRKLCFVLALTWEKTGLCSLIWAKAAGLSSSRKSYASLSTAHRLIFSIFILSLIRASFPTMFNFYYSLGCLQVLKPVKF